MIAPVPPGPPILVCSTLPTPEDGFVVERIYGVVFGAALCLQSNGAVSSNTREAEALQWAKETIRARVAAMKCMELEARARRRDANAVLGVTFDMERINGVATVTCWGTACVVKAGARIAQPVAAMPAMPQ
eukprot:scpid101733/ scgid1586/ 